MNELENFDFEDIDVASSPENIDESIEIPEHLIRASDLDNRLPEQKIEAYGDDPKNYEKPGPSVSIVTDDGTTGVVDFDDDIDYSYLEP